MLVFYTRFECIFPGVSPQKLAVIQRPRKNYAQKAVMWVEVPYREFENAARVLR